MADVKVQNHQNPQQEGKSVQTRDRSRDLSRRGGDPFGFSLMPSEFFGTDPFSLMRRMHEEMERDFGRFFGESRGEGMWNPAIEVSERNNQLQVCAELPGLKPEDVNVEVTDDALIIQGERKYEHEGEEGGMHRSERRYGRFYRSIPLPEGVNADQAKAQYRDGVLEITMPLLEQKSQRRSIPIEGVSRKPESK